VRRSSLVGPAKAAHRHVLDAVEARVDLAEGVADRVHVLADVVALATEKQAAQPQALSMFYRWQDAAWKRSSPMPRGL